MNMSRSEVKITIEKLLEVAYSENKGLTTKILAVKGKAKLTVDQSGRATLTGTVGAFSFSGSPVLSKIGVKIKRVTVNFENKGSMKVGYTATFTHAFVSLNVSGTFDLDELITSCSGFLCQAARALKNRHKAYEMELQLIMGR